MPLLLDLVDVKDAVVSIGEILIDQSLRSVSEVDLRPMFGDLYGVALTRD